MGVSISLDISKMIRTAIDQRVAFLRLMGEDPITSQNYIADEARLYQSVLRKCEAHISTIEKVTREFLVKSFGLKRDFELCLQSLSKVSLHLMDKLSDLEVILYLSFDDAAVVSGIACWGMNKTWVWESVALVGNTVIGLNNH